MAFQSLDYAIFCVNQGPKMSQSSDVCGCIIHVSQNPHRMYWAGDELNEKHILKMDVEGMTWLLKISMSQNEVIEDHVIVHLLIYLYKKLNKEKTWEAWWNI